MEKRTDTFLPERPGISKLFKVTPTNLAFDSDF